MKTLRLPIAFSLLLILTACGTTRGLQPQPSPSQLESDAGTLSATAVDISQRCRQLAKQVKEPAPIADGLKLIRQYRAALELANKRLGVTDECIARLAADYAQGLTTRK